MERRFTVFRIVKRSLIGVVTILVAVIAYAGISPNGRYYYQLFAFGVKHGAEDRQSGITYGTGTPALRVVRNSENWTSSEKILVHRLFTESSALEKTDISIFMAGYACGDNAPVCWAVAAGLVAGAAGLAFRGRSRKRFRA